MALFDVGKRPRHSAIAVGDSADGESVTLLFPRFAGWPWAALACLMGTGCLLWGWPYLVRSLQWDQHVAGDRKMGAVAVVGAALIVFAIVSMLGRYRLTITASGIRRDVCLFGWGTLGAHAQFSTIQSIGREKYGRADVIWIYPAQRDRFNIEHFASTDERDWVAEELTRLWQTATGRGINEGDPPRAVLDV
jgi:hypothetical protein